MQYWRCDKHKRLISVNFEESAQAHSRVCKNMDSLFDLTNEDLEDNFSNYLVQG